MKIKLFLRLINYQNNKTKSQNSFTNVFSYLKNQFIY
jgi:hypothetical protein